jgi:hypothetical protein
VMKQAWPAKAKATQSNLFSCSFSHHIIKRVQREDLSVVLA